MGRNKEFDPDAVLDAAMTLFWRRGYEATSTADLVAETGIARGSLYATFHSKHELYLRALDHYVRDQHPMFVKLLSRTGPMLPAVRGLVESYAAEAANGCFVVNAAVERMSDDAVAARVRSSWDTLEVALSSALLRAQAQGELPADAEPGATARFLLVFLQGIRVVGPDEQNPERLADAVRTALAILD
jgi:TetR/AcrR family transcriptional repressor of nem operon